MQAWRLTDYAWLLILLIMAGYFVALVAWGLWCWWLGWAASRWYAISDSSRRRLAYRCRAKPWYVRKWDRREALRGM
jgi:hypothetical protein